ncbi:MAG TPA: hypothetical protein VFC23_03335 [Thermoanaerobaculia bacterium]|nr:hypothetical protein [Thermoanaerobaculia bacterium]
MKKLMAAASVFFLLLIPVAAHGQHSLGMHAHSGTGSASACLPGRFDGPIPLFPLAQAGDLNHKVSTSNPRAQQFFNQGLTFFYGFDSESALRSFHQAAVEDPNLAMAYWGVALAAGGDLNIPIDDPCMQLAIEQSKMANQRLARATAPEQLYVNALAQRYATGSNPGSDVPLRDAQQLGVYYTLAMKSVYEKLGSQDPEAGALYAYSLMNLRPWLWWTTAGQPSVEIDETLRVLKAGLHDFPLHVGLNHMQVHAMEEAPVDQAERARSAAELLVKKAPFITPHLRHMPAHTFLLLGNWDQVVAANQRAVEADQPWAEACREPSVPACNQLLVGHYYSHDMLFLDVGYNNRGEWVEVEPLSERLENTVLKFIGTQPGLEHYLTTKVAMRVHFAKWQELAKLPPPQSGVPNPKDPKFCADLKYKLATAMWYFGRGMGHASLGLPTDDDLFGFQQAQGCVQNAGLGWGNNSASAILAVVRWRLLERIARMKGLKDASETFALLAVETEDLLDYDEPPGWYLSSRETYGASLFLNGEFKKAELVFREDLKRRPNDSRSLFGLWQALAAQHSSEAAIAKERFERQWRSSVLPNIQDM